MARVVGLHTGPRKAHADGPGLPKSPVASVQLTARGVAGDWNHWRAAQPGGDPGGAVLFLGEEVLDALRAEGWPVGPGHLGENVLTRGLPNDATPKGTRLRIGDALVEVDRACAPCTKLFTLPYVGEARGPEFLRTTLGRRGWYARVLEEGDVAVGADVRVV